MNMPIAKEEIALLFPQALDFGAARARQKARGLRSWLRRVLLWIAEQPQRRAVIEELSALSDRELADIGLRRADLPRIFDPGFAARGTAQTA